MSMQAMYCRTCKRALNRYKSADGQTVYLHAMGETDHTGDPVPLERMPDAIMMCDFCSCEGPSWYYDVSEEAIYDKREQGTRIVSHAEVHTGRYANRVREATSREARRQGLRGAAGTVEHYGDRWTACDGCAAHIDASDLWGLVGRVVDSLPASASKGKKLVPLRGAIAGLYEGFLSTVKGKTPIGGG